MARKSKLTAGKVTLEICEMQPLYGSEAVVFLSLCLSSYIVEAKDVPTGYYYIHCHHFASLNLQKNRLRKRIFLKTVTD